MDNNKVQELEDKINKILVEAEPSDSVGALVSVTSRILSAAAVRGDQETTFLQVEQLIDAFTDCLTNQCFAICSRS